MRELSQPVFLLYVCALAVLLGTAAWRDVVTRTIPDTISIALILLGSAVRLAQGWAALGTSLMVAIALFAILLPLCSRGILGGADLKLLTALAVGFSPQTSLDLIIAVTAVGGVLAGAYLLIGKLLRVSGAASATYSKTKSRLSRVVTVEFWRIRRRAPLPYGVAIAIGTAVVVLQQQGV